MDEIESTRVDERRPARCGALTVQVDFVEELIDELVADTLWTHRGHRLAELHTVDGTRAVLVHTPEVAPGTARQTWRPARAHGEDVRDVRRGCEERM